MHFSPKILGLNVGIFRTVFGQSRTEFRTVIRLCVLFLCVIAEKMNNMLVVRKNHVDICLFDVLTWIT